MSNIVAGDIFLKIIEEVVNASQTDFEENGVNQQTLNELQQTWQQKLSVRNVAQMPWDPKPAPPPQIVQTAPASQGPTPARAYAPPQNHMQPDGQTHIKREPGTDQSYNGIQQGGPAYASAPNPELAAQRAVGLIQQQFGSQANASLTAMQQRGIALPGQQKPPGGLQLPGQNQQALQQQYAQQMKQQTANQQPRIKMEDGQQEQKPYPPQGQNLAYAQTDGAGDAMEDWSKFMAATRGLSAEQVASNDRFVRSQVNQGSRTLENGLMMPLDQHKRRATSKRTPHGRRMPPSQNGSSQLATIPQLDGVDDDDDDEKPDIKDEDAINSDLDDDEDEAANAEDDDDDIDSMLCTYDKVQRVKNKWKCTLKDGVLSANGKEYLFHKAQGEFEW